jgi:hypothetical protein
MKLVSFLLCREYCFGQCIFAVGELCICQSVRITVVYLPVSRDCMLLLCSQKVFKYDGTNVIEF